ncbi:hypothetical protein [Anaerofustis butyriciformans]|uniref:hypothetical protein n=1 Tax=Anaerofustis butyriciformans TaxID=3108533 RepID=UPI002E370871|nr:hypothetical protein [Anaerofustis sp. HA2171]
MLTAFYNVNRPKGKNPLKLWKKKPKKVKKEEYQNNIKIIEDMEKREGKSWVYKIYKANGIKNKKGG